MSKGNCQKYVFGGTKRSVCRSISLKPLVKALDRLRRVCGASFSTRRVEILIVNAPGHVFRVEFASTNARWMTSFAAVSPGRRVPFRTSICFLMGLKFRCMRSTPTERMSTRLRCLVCLASTGVKAPGTMLPSSVQGRRWVNYAND